MLIELINSFNWWIAIGIFFAYILIDGGYAYYTYTVTQYRPKTAATTGTIMHILLAFGVFNYVNNLLYVIPLCFGSWIGTYIVVKRKKAIDGHHKIRL